MKKCVYCGKELEDFESVCPRCNENQTEHTTTKDMYQEAYDEFYNEFYKKMDHGNAYDDAFKTKSYVDKNDYDELESDEVLKEFIEKHNIPKEVVEEYKQKAKNNELGHGCFKFIFFTALGLIIFVVIMLVSSSFLP